MSGALIRLVGAGDINLRDISLEKAAKATTRRAPRESVWMERRRSPRAVLRSPQVGEGGRMSRRGQERACGDVGKPHDLLQAVSPTA